MNQQKIAGLWGFSLLLSGTVIIVLVLAWLLADLISHGWQVISWSFLTAYPRHGMMEGGIFTPIVGTFWVTILTTLLALPLGVASAVYLHEYARDNSTTRLIRAAIRNLAGVPSVIYGLFGVALFVDGMQLGASLLASGLTLGLLTLPYIITIAEEALKTVPKGLREGAYALGATQWETVWTIVLPGARSGILTGAILALSRAAGETAPILFTGVVFYQRYLPSSPFDTFMTLPYHLYVLATQHHAIEQVRPVAYGTALVLVALILLLNMLAFFLRNQLR